jgi:hypothetical protein
MAKSLTTFFSNVIIILEFVTFSPMRSPSCTFSDYNCIQISIFLITGRGCYSIPSSDTLSRINAFRNLTRVLASVLLLSSRM